MQNGLTEAARVDVQRLVYRCLSGFLVDEMKHMALVTDGDVVDGIIFTAITQRGGLAAVNASGVAASLALPAETVRRKVLRLITLGLIDRSQDGALTLSRSAIESQARRWRVTTERFLITAAALKGLGFAPDLFAQPPERRTVDFAQAAFIVDNVLLRAAERAIVLYGSLTKALIFTVALYMNSFDITYDRKLAWRYAGADTPPPDTLRQPVKVLEVAAALRLPRETVRRQMREMQAAGMLDQGPRGYLASQAFMLRPDILEGARATIQAFERALRDLSRAGVDLIALQPLDAIRALTGQAYA